MSLAFAEAKFIVLEDRGVLAIGGPDRASFLQGLVSNDAAKISPQRAIYAALLTAQGKYLHDFMLVEIGKTIWLDGEATRLADLTRRLTMYRLRSKVTIDERPDLAVTAIYRGDPPGEPGAAEPLGDGVVFVDPRLAALGARAITSREQIGDALQDKGAAPADFAEYDRLRLGLGVPDGSRDLVLDKSILLEAGFEELHGVDWRRAAISARS